jgi:hypothetical protein
LPNLEEHRLPADKRLVIEIILPYELPDYPLEELFWFSNNHDLLEPLNGSIEETSPAPMAISNTLPADRTSGYSFDLSSTIEASSYNPDLTGTIEDPL